jgi:RNA polymerase sigma factor (sigma-70 family)
MDQRKTELKEMSDSEVIAGILEGHGFLYEKLMRKYNQRLYRVALAILNNESEIEDVMQTVYINAYLKLSSFEGKSSFSTWLTRILINECLMRKKKQQKMTDLSEIEQQQETSHNPLNEMMKKELKFILEKKISELPEKYRTVFMMREIEELSTKETMEILSLSESNVKIRLNRAKEMLRNSLSSEYRTAQLFDFNLVRCDRVVNYVMKHIFPTGDEALHRSVQGN